jgi:hypothetical protein
MAKGRPAQGLAQAGLDHLKAFELKTVDQMRVLSDLQCDGY